METKDISQNRKHSSSFFALLTVCLGGTLLGLAGLTFCEVVLIAIDISVFHAGSWTLPRIILCICLLTTLLFYVLWVSASMLLKIKTLFESRRKPCRRN